MMTARTRVCALIAGAGLVPPALAQTVYSPADPVLREALRRVYPTPSGPTDGAGGPDVIVGEIESWGCCPQGTQIAPEASSGGIVAYGLGTSSCNISTAAAGGQHLLWLASTPYHPIIPQNLYRLKTVNGATRLVQLGQSWSKYAFVALTDNVCNIGCSGVGGSVLGMGCSDPYTASRNATQSSAGPRYECNPFTGVFQDSPAIRASWPAASTVLHRRLQVAATEIDPALNAGALYFGEAMYVNRDDACFGNSKNNASYRRLTIASPSNTLTLQGTSNGVSTGTVRTKPAIYAWRDNGLGIGVPDNDVLITEVTCGNTFFNQPPYPYTTGGSNPGSALVLPAGDGWVYVASKATNLGGGIWHYEYAVENLNSDRGIGSFRINFNAGTVITNAQMRQVDCHSGLAADDANRNAVWTQSVNSDHVIWASPNTYSAATPRLGSYIRWGTLYNFRFDANVAPAANGDATLGYYKPLTGYANTIAAAAKVPTATVVPNCYADCDGVGGLTANDFSCFLIAYVTGLSYANCDGVGGLTANDFSCFLIRYVGGCS